MMRFLKSPFFMRGFPLIWVLGVGSLAFIWHLGSTGLIDQTEPVFAETARQMLERGDWVTPYFNGAMRFDKPPLIYWLIAVGYQVIGINEWAARLPSALAAIALMGVCCYVLQHYSHPFAELAIAPKVTLLASSLGAAIVAINPLMLVWGRVGVSDLLLTATLSIGLLCFFCGYASADKKIEPVNQSNQRLNNLLPASSLASHLCSFTTFPVRFSFLPSTFYLLFYGFTALAVLAKGFVGIALPLVILSSFLLYCGNGRQVWREMRPLIGVGLMLAIALPWYALVIARHGQVFIEKFFYYHHVERFTHVISKQTGPWYYYLIVLLIGFAPWSVFLPAAIARVKFWRRRYWQKQPRSAQLSLFAVFWLVGVLSFFSFAVTKLPNYILPLIPAGAILVTLFWSEQAASKPGAERRVDLIFSGSANLLLFLGLTGIAVYLPALLMRNQAQSRLVLALVEQGSFNHCGEIALATAGAIALMLLIRQERWLWLPNLVSMTAFIGFGLIPLLFTVDAERQKPLRQLARHAATMQQPSDVLIMLGARKSSLVFYAHQPVRFFRARDQIVRFTKTELSQQATLLIIGKKDDVANLQLSPGTYRPLQQAGQYELIWVAHTALSR